MYLGIDYGLKHIGLATAEGSFSEPRESLHPKNDAEAAALVAKKASDWGVKTLVVGVSEGKSKDLAVTFGRRLEEMTGLEVKFVDETLSTNEAKKISKTKSFDDHSLSAAVILQRYLDDLAGEKISDLSYTT